MYPVVFRIGSFEVTSFGLMVAIGAMVGLWLFRRELLKSGLPESATDSALAGLIGGIIGAKLLYVAENMSAEPALDLLTDRGGMSWFGGLVGGLLAGLSMMAIRGWPILALLSAATPALALGHLLGRIGCFLVGDDYGRPTSLPWGVAFPQGLPPTDVPVHPTQLYEASFLGVLVWLLIRWRRRGVADAVVVGRYLVLAGGFRFALEFLRINTRVAGPLTVAHLFALGIVGAGVALILWRRWKTDIGHARRGKGTVLS
jgi:phosphatidylglycerol:prolipoprotein diacylglycerol transferase